MVAIVIFTLKYVLINGQKSFLEIIGWDTKTFVGYESIDIFYFDFIHDGL